MEIRTSMLCTFAQAVDLTRPIGTLDSRAAQLPTPPDEDFMPGKST